MIIPRTPGLPLALRIAAVLAGAEGLALLGYAVLELVALSSGRITMGVTTAAFFAVYAAMLLAAARGVLSGRSWGRGPLVFAQLVWLGVAWSFRGGETTWVALLLGGAAGLVLVGLLLPASLRALDRAEPR